MRLLTDETIVLRLRRHPIVFFLQIFPFLVLAFVPVAAYLWLQNNPMLLGESEELAAAIILGTSFFYLFIILCILYTFFDYFLDEWIVTNKHILDIEQKALFNRVVAKEELSRIQDITMEVKGILPTLFNYGDILIQTASEKQRVFFRQISNPQEVIEITSKLLAVEKKIEEKTPTTVKVVSA